ncbi:Rz-like spanin [Dickeya phage Dagda]|uniref:Rz lysis protein n=2 Tax=Aarhusvirus dagda TaxID=2732762 RepID=A0A2S1GSJ3_9CAUD|nr:Rz-like spanin [Dickeya phage Dagda]AWD92353.1 Rz lysis protein [Dickeya phage Dagda]AXY81651.1 Rz lysis protein [Dickeya phage Dagda_B1]
MFETIKKYAQAVMLVAVLAFSAGCYFYGHSMGYNERDVAAKLESFKSQNAWQAAMLEEQNDKQKQLSEQGRIYQENLAKNQADTARTLDDLRKSGNRLRIRVSTCEATKSSSTGGPSSDGYAELSGDAAQVLVSESRRADEWIKRLQETVKVLQSQTKEVK